MLQTYSDYKDSYNLTKNSPLETVSVLNSIPAGTYILTLRFSITNTLTVGTPANLGAAIITSAYARIQWNSNNLYYAETTMRDNTLIVSDLSSNKITTAFMYGHDTFTSATTFNLNLQYTVNTVSAQGFYFGSIVNLVKIA